MGIPVKPLKTVGKNIPISTTKQAIGAGSPGYILRGIEAVKNVLEPNTLTKSDYDQFSKRNLDNLNPNHRVLENDVGSVLQKSLADKKKKADLVQERLDEKLTLHEARKLDSSIPQVRHIKDDRRRILDILSTPLPSTVHKWLGDASKQGYTSKGLGPGTRPKIPDDFKSTMSMSDIIEGHHGTFPNFEGGQFTKLADELGAAFKVNAWQYMAKNFKTVPGSNRSSMWWLPKDVHQQQLHPWLKDMGFEDFWTNLRANNPDGLSGPELMSKVDEYFDTIVFPSLIKAKALLNNNPKMLDYSYLPEEVVELAQKHLLELQKPIQPGNIRGSQAGAEQAIDDLHDLADSSRSYSDWDTDSGVAFEKLDKPEPAPTVKKTEPTQFSERIQNHIKRSQEIGITEPSWKNGSIDYIWRPETNTGQIDIPPQSAKGFKGLRDEFFKQIEELPSGSVWELNPKFKDEKRRRIYSKLFEGDSRITRNTDPTLGWVLTVP